MSAKVVQAVNSVKNSWNNGQPDEGKVYIAGKDISNLKNSELAKFRRTHIGFIYQDYKLIPEYTAYENIILPLILDSEEDDEEEVTELMESLG